MKKSVEITENAKISSITAYFTFVGFIIAFFINLEEKHPFANFHLRQALGIQTLFFATAFLLSNFQSLGAEISFLIFFFTIWTYGIYTAINKETKAVPIIGSLFQRIFSFIK